MTNLPLAFADLLAGAVIGVAGVTGTSVADTLRGNVTMHPFDLGLSLGGGPGGDGSPTLGSGGNAGGFLPPGAMYKQNRTDQGRDFQTNPGGPIVAPGAGYVIRVGSDPGGFGPAYPVVHFDSGPFAGKDMYIGHTISALSAGAHFVAGQVLSHTGTSGIGNATTPGWAEIGYAPGGSPGPFGQPAPF